MSVTTRMVATSLLVAVALTGCSLAESMAGGTDTSQVATTEVEATPSPTLTYEPNWAAVGVAEEDRPDSAATKPPAPYVPKTVDKEPINRHWVLKPGDSMITMVAEEKFRVGDYEMSVPRTFKADAKTGGLIHVGQDGKTWGYLDVQTDWPEYGPMKESWLPECLRTGAPMQNRTIRNSTIGFSGRDSVAVRSISFECLDGSNDVAVITYWQVDSVYLVFRHYGDHSAEFELEHHLINALRMS